MNLYPPGPRTKVLGGVPTGDANAQDAATAIATNTALGSAPNCLEIAIPIGHKSAAEAVLDINCVKPQEIINKTAVTIIGDGLPPINPTAQLAINLPAPVLSIAEDTGIIPANKKIVTQSIEE